MEDERCPVCGKRRHSTWAEAARGARWWRRHRDLRMRPYWSRRCQCYHYGASPKGVPTKSRKLDKLAPV